MRSCTNAGTVVMMMRVTSEPQIIGIIAEGEIVETSDGGEAKIAKLAAEGYGYALVRVPHEAAETFRGPVRVFASALTDRRVEDAVRLVENLTPQIEPPSAETVLQSRRNARLRAKFMEEYPMLSSEEVAKRSGSRATNRAAAANRWRSRGQIFAVRSRNELRYPAFQFDDDGRPRPEMETVLSAFAEHDTSEWEIALWFTSTHPRAGRCPVEILDDEPQLVELLARQSLDIQQ
jgi:hypothetical protein